MSEFTGETLYNLLPTVYRTRDAAQGWPLRALLGLMETQVVALESDIAKLYDNWFIETCDEWVVPYIGDLLQVRQLRPIAKDARSTSLFTSRGYVANTLAYRRRKGTRALLEKLAQDVAGWPCVAVEFFQRLATTQHVNHTRLDNRKTIDIRNPEPLELIDGAFDRATHTLEVRHASNERGKYNVPCVGLFLWRLIAMELKSVVAVKDAGGGERFRVNPLGADVQLFNPRDTSESFAVDNRESSIPGPLRRLGLDADLEAVRQAIAETGKPIESSYFAGDPPFVINIVGEPAAIPPEQIAICDLSDWRLPAKDREYTRKDGTKVKLPIRVAIDPVTGRFAFPTGVTPAEVRTSFSYGFSGPIGAGIASRTVEPVGDRVLYVVSGGGGAFSTQLAKWVTDKPTSAVIEIQDSLTYTLPAALDVPAGFALEIRGAADQRPLLTIANPASPWPIELNADSALVIDGVAIAAGFEVASEEDTSLTIRDATLVPGRALKPDGTAVVPGAASVLASEVGGTFTVTIERCIVGPIRLPLQDPESGVVTESRLVIADSIVDGIGGADATLIAGSAKIDRCTVFGHSAFTVLERASDSVFTDKVIVERTQEGCCRFSFVPEGSKVPRTYRCQPRMALEAMTDPIARQATLDRVQPAFTSVRYIDAGYAQLAHSCASEIRGGAEDESEMGVWQFLHQPQREANLRAAVDEYLRFGLEAGLFLVT
ncbi:MAG TPA: hypothetical protein VIV40_25800 [Kofleriaceae bacterium]